MSHQPPAPPTPPFRSSSPPAGLIFAIIAVLLSIIGTILFFVAVLDVTNENFKAFMVYATIATGLGASFHAFSIQDSLRGARSTGEDKSNAVMALCLSIGTLAFLFVAYFIGTLVFVQQVF